MKRILAILLSLVMCLSMSVTAFAASDVSPETKEYDLCLSVEDSDDTLSVVLNAVTAVTDGVITITYDTEVVSLGTDAAVAADTVDMCSVNSSEEGTLKISWLSEEAATGTLFTLGFALKDGAEITSDTFKLAGEVVDADNIAMTLAVVISGKAGGDEGNEVDKSVLQTLYDAGLMLAEEDYTAESWADFAAAMDAALAVLEDEEAVQSAVDAAAEDLSEAMQALEPVKIETVDKSALQTLYDNSLMLVEEDYTAESWADFAAAMDAALLVLEDEDAAQEDVDGALADLLESIAGLEPTAAEEVNKDALLVAYEASLKLNEDDYTADSWSVLAEAQENALAVLENEDATQEDVDGALADLVAAIRGLAETAAEQESVDKSKLQAAYDSSLKLNKSDYTADSWSEMTDAQKAALAVLEDDDATQEDVDAALSALLTSVKALKSKTSAAANSKTGDNEPIYLWTVLVLIAAAVVVLFAYKKARIAKK